MNKLFKFIKNVFTKNTEYKLIIVLWIFVIVTSIFAGEWYRQSKCFPGNHCYFKLDQELNEDGSGYQTHTCEEIPRSNDKNMIKDGMITIIVLVSIMFVGWFIGWLNDRVKHFKLAIAMIIYIICIAASSWILIRNKCYQSGCGARTDTGPIISTEDEITCDNGNEPIPKRLSAENEDIQTNLIMKYIPENEQCCPNDDGICGDNFTNVYNNRNSILEPFTQVEDTLTYIIFYNVDNEEIGRIPINDSTSYIISNTPASRLDINNYMIDSNPITDIRSMDLPAYTLVRIYGSPTGGNPIINQIAGREGKRIDYIASRPRYIEIGNMTPSPTPTPTPPSPSPTPTPTTTTALASDTPPTPVSIPADPRYLYCDKSAITNTNKKEAKELYVSMITLSVLLSAVFGRLIYQIE